MNGLTVEMAPARVAGSVVAARNKAGRFAKLVATLASACGSIMLFAIACSSTAVMAEEAPYLIQPGDVLQISVWKEPDLQSEVLVRSDGGISFPLAGDLSAAGLTLTDVSAALAAKIGAYIPDAVVSVAVKTIGGNRVYVVGKVNRPGEFTFVRPIDVMQALSLAGGTTPFASLGDIHILRRDEQTQTALRFDYADVASGKNLRSNILLRTGDTVVVQ